MPTILAAFVLLLAACGERTGTPKASGQPSDHSEFVYAGFIVGMEGNRILVTGSVEKDFSANGGASHYYEATWFSNAGSGLEVGQRVRVWPEGGIAESYPGQGKASRVEVVEPPKAEGADLTEAEAIRKALEAPRGSGMFPPAVKAAEYEAESGRWRIELAQNGDAGTAVIEVPDRL